MSLGELSDLIGLAYDAAFDADFWPLVLNRLAGRMLLACIDFL